MRTFTLSGIGHTFGHLLSAGMRVAGVLLMVFGAGCQTHPTPYPEDRIDRSKDPVRRLEGATESRIDALIEELERLGDSVDSKEALAVAEVAVRESERLAKAYRVWTPSWAHNGLVNLRLRQRGLCFHYADDLMAELNQLESETLEFERAISLQGTWLEHNAVVVTTRETPFEKGLLLDAWAHAGDLAIGRVDELRRRWRRFGELPQDDDSSSY